MTNRENFYETVRFGKPEKVLHGIPGYGLGYFGVNHQGYDDRDMEDGHARPVGSVWQDIWGTTWHKEYPDVMGFPKVYPLSDMENMKTYVWPDFDDERLISRIFEKKEAYREDMDSILIGPHRDTLWEKSYMLVGMENMMTYFYSEPEYAKEVLHRVMDFQLGIAKHYISAGVEMVGLGDDLGVQNSLLLSPEIINEFLVPEYRRLFNFYKERGVVIEFHSCGHVEPLLELFIELGVNILNPIQVTANSLDNIIRITRNRMALEGGISTKLIMDGPVDDIRDAVKKTIALLGMDGGYFCAADQWMPFPKENYEALVDAVEEYGRYPLEKYSICDAQRGE